MTEAQAPIVLYHWTTDEAARAILEGGFPDEEESSSFTGSDSLPIDRPEKVGVWLTDALPEPGDPYLSAVLQVTLELSPAELARYESVEEGQPPGWYVPAAVLNRSAHVRRTDEHS